MTTVTNQTELINALTQGESEIIVANDFVLSTTINIEHTVTISSNTTTIFTLLKSATFYGNVIRVRNGGNLTLKNIIIDGNKDNHPIENTTNRSLLIVMGGTLTLQENVAIQNNNTYLEGGGVYLSGSVDYANHFIMESNAIIRGCYARTNGGGIIAAIRNIEDTVEIRGQAVIENNDANYGGGFYYRIYTEGIKGVVSISDSPIFRNNTTRNSGAGIAIFNIANNNESLNFQILGTPLINDNSAVNHGGGIYFVGTNPSDRLEIGASHIQQNKAGGYGGGIYTSGVITNLTTTVIYQNIAGTGGGLYFLTNTGGTLEITLASILYNQATNNASGSGGGIWINNRSTTLPLNLQLSNSSISYNNATAQGGGLYISESSSGIDVVIENVEIKNNEARTNGAGMLLGAAGVGTIRLLNSTVTSNVSNNYGGGIYLSNEKMGLTTVWMDNCNISKNQANMQGGGLRFASGQGSMKVTLESCMIEENLAQTSSGGGIWCGGNDINLDLTQTTTINNNETVEGNGGGIYFNSRNGVLQLKDNVKISNNLANKNTMSIRNQGGGIYLVPGILFVTGNSEIFGNKSKYGGGIGAGEQTTITIESGTIHNNEAIWGGGIYNQASTIYFQGGTISNNQAEIGGGIYNDQYLYILKDATMEANTATSMAPGIYNGSSAYIEGERNLENGVYIENSEAVLQITKEVTTGSIIQIDNSDYVTPDDALSPIIVAVATPSHSTLTLSDLQAFKKPLVGFDNWEYQLLENNTQIGLVKRVVEEYTITYKNLYGATHSNPTMYTTQTPTIVLAPPSTVCNKLFNGWYNEQGVRVFEIPQGSSGNIILTATWINLKCCKKKEKPNKCECKKTSYQNFYSNWYDNFY